MQRILYLFLLVIGLWTSGQSQDIHFSQFFLSPLTLNPANTGNFSGSLRIGGIFRDQWFTPTTFNSFVTFSASVDAPIMKGFREKDWVGVGMMAFQDKAGSLGLQYTGGWMSAAYHFALDKDQNSTFSIGIQGGALSRTIDMQLLSAVEPTAKFPAFYSEIVSSSQSTDRNQITEPEKDRGGKVDYSAGVLYRGLVGEGTYMSLGATVNHITTPNRSLVQGTTYDLPMKIQIHGSATFGLSDKFLLTPMALFQSVANTGEINLVAMGGYVLDAEKPKILNFGTGYRFGDALEVFLGLDIGDLRVGLGYDLPFGGTKGPGAKFNSFELGASYIARIYKKPKVDNILFCPRF